MTVTVLSGTECCAVRGGYVSAVRTPAGSPMETWLLFRLWANNPNAPSGSVYR